MAWRVQHLEPQRARADRLPLDEFAVEFDDRRRDREAQPARLQREGVVEREIGRMQEARAAAARAQFAERADVIDVRVGVDERRRPQTVRGQPLRDDIDVVPAVDHDRLAAGLVTQDRAGAFQGTDREVLDDHPSAKS